MRVSVVIPSRDETLLADTVAAFLKLGADEIVVIDDASRKPVKREDLTDGNVVLVRNKRAGGPGACRAQGAELATGDVLMWADAHVFPTRVREFGEVAVQTQGQVTAAGSGLRDDREVIPWLQHGVIFLRDSKQEFAPYQIKWQPPKLTGVAPVMGVCGGLYAMTRDAYKRMGGWPPTAAWGYNEQAFSWAAQLCNVPVLCDTETIARHLYRGAKCKLPAPYVTPHGLTVANYYRVHRVLCEEETWRGYWKPLFDRVFARDARFANASANHPEMTARHKAFQELRRITDYEWAQKINDTALLEWFDKRKAVAA